jgi:hypothetical protein
MAHQSHGNGTLTLPSPLKGEGDHQRDFLHSPLSLKGRGLVPVAERSEAQDKGEGDVDAAPNKGNFHRSMKN